jgi:AcrR family transcriptional regulator
VIRRATFYKHFADKYEFYIFFIRDMQASFETEVIPFYASEQPQEYFIRMTRKLIEFLGEHQSMVDCIFKSDLLPALVYMLSEQIIIVAKERLAESAKNGVKLPASPEILASFYVGGLLQVLGRRFSQKTLRAEKSEEALMAEIESIIHSISVEV